MALAPDVELAERTRSWCGRSCGSSSPRESWTIRRGLKTEQCHKNMVETLVKRIESFNGTGFQDWKFKFEMAVKAIQTGALDMLQTSETSEKEVCFSSEIEQQISSKIYFILAQKLQGEAFDLVKNVPELNGIEAWRRLSNRFDARTLGKRVHLIRKCVNPPKIKKVAGGNGND